MNAVPAGCELRSTTEDTESTEKRIVEKEKAARRVGCCAIAPAPAASPVHHRGHREHGETWGTRLSG